MSYDLGTAHGKITLDYDGDRAVAKAEGDIDKLERKAKTSDKEVVNLGKSLGILGKGVKLGGMVAALSTAAVQAASLGIQILGIIPNLVSIASLSAALPGIYVGIAASVGVLKAAFAGVGDAIGAAFDTEHPEKFEAALKKLSPAAASFVTALHNAAPVLKQFQLGLQEAFFKAADLTEQVPRMLKALSGLKPTLDVLAGDFGELTRQVANFALSRDSLSFINDAIVAFDASVMSAGRALIPMLIGLRDVGEVGLPLLLRLGDAAGDVGIKFGEWLTEISNDGRLQAWIDTALGTLSTLGDIIGNVGSILNSVLSAANATGGGLLNTIAEITGQFATFLKSAEGNAAITNLFSSIMAIAKQLGPVLTTLAGALAKALAPALAQIATDVGPVLLDVVQRLAPALGPLAGAIADLLSAVAPLAPPLAELISLLAQGLATAVGSLVREFGPLLAIVSKSLTSAFEKLGPSVEALAAGLPNAAEAGVALAEAFAPLMPVIVELAQVIADSLVKALPDLLQAGQDLIPVIADLAATFSTALVEALKALVVILPPLIEGFAKVAPLLLQMVLIGPRLLAFLIQFVGAIVSAVAAVGSFVGSLVSGFVGALTAAYNAVVSAGGAIIRWFTDLPGMILNAIKAIPGLLLATIENAFKIAATAAGFGAGLLVGIYTKLPGKIWNAIQAIPGLVRDLFNRAWQMAQQITVSSAAAVIKFFHDLPGRARSALGALGSSIASVARSALGSMRSAVSSGIDGVINFFRNLPRRAKSSLGNTASLLRGSGAAIIQGLINGIQSGIDRVMGMVRNLAGRVKDAFNSALSIFSPSRVFVESGVNIDEGLIIGLKKKMAAVASTAKQLAKTVIAPTLKLPKVGLTGISAMPAIQRATTAAAVATQEFGPYNLAVDGKVITSFAIDAITGNPRTVAAANAEGSRRASWTGSGRSAS